MFSVLDDAALLTKRAAAYIAGKGATMTAVAIASAFIGPASSLATIPIIAMAVGLPVTAALSTMTHRHRETMIMNNFREEIAASFGIMPEEVTNNHLRTLAYGNPDAGIEPHPFFEQIIRKNDKHRWIDIGGNIAGALATCLFVAFQAGKIGSIITHAAAATGIAALSAPWVPVVGTMLVAGVMAGAMDSVLTNLGMNFFGEKELSGYEILENLARQKGRGIELSQDQVMGLIAAVDPHIQQDIAQRFNGARYNTLSPSAREELIHHYNGAYDIQLITEKINRGEVKINELAFVSAGERSGVPEQTHTSTTAQSHGRLGIKKRLSQAKNHIRDTMEDKGLAARVLQGDMNTSAKETPPEWQSAKPLSQAPQESVQGGFVERYAGGERDNSRDISHVERLQLEETKPRTLH